MSREQEETVRPSALYRRKTKQVLSVIPVHAALLNRCKSRNVITKKGFAQPWVVVPVDLSGAGAGASPLALKPAS